MAAGQDVMVSAPHLETRAGKRRWLERRRHSAHSRGSSTMPPSKYETQKQERSWGTTSTTWNQNDRVQGWKLTKGITRFLFRLGLDFPSSIYPFPSPWPFILPPLSLMVPGISSSNLCTLRLLFALLIYYYYYLALICFLSFLYLSFRSFFSILVTTYGLYHKQWIFTNGLLYRL